MYTLLIVDDERLAREDIVYKIKSSGIHFEWIMDAEDAEEAIEIIKSNRPDIMLTDIVMGEKSGLDLLEEANVLAPDMVTMIICGHSDFAFARRAIRLNVTNYLLKPVKEMELKEALAEVTTEVDHRKVVHSLSKENYLLFKNSVSSRIREETNSFMNGSERTGLKHILSSIPRDAVWYQFLTVRLGLCQEEINLQDEEYKEATEKALVFGIINIIHELGCGKLLPVEINEKSNTLSIFAASRRQDKAIAQQEIMAYIKQAVCIVAEALQVELIFGISSMQNEFRCIQTLEASKALDMRFCTRESQYLFDETRFEKFAASRNADISALKKFIDAADLKNATRMVATMVSAYPKNQYTDIRELYTHVVDIVVKSCYRKGISIIQFLGAESIKGYILNSFDTADEITTDLTRIISLAIGYMTGGSQDISSVLAEARRFIDESFSNSELCTHLLSHKFCISPGYLSASFKKAYGVAISQYIISKRMDYAMTLLSTTDALLNDIAESSGFNSLSYFFRVFKGYFGDTPSQHRDRNGIT